MSFELRASPGIPAPAWADPPRKKRGPTLLRDALLERRADLINFYSRRNENMRRWRQIYFREHPLNTPPQFDQVRLPTAYQMVSLAIGMMAAELPTIEVPRLGGDARRSNLIEQWLYAFWARAGKNRIRPIFHDLWWFAFTSGMFVIKVLFDPEAWGEPPQPPTPPGPEPPRPAELDDPAEWERVWQAYLADLAAWTRELARYEAELGRYQAERRAYEQRKAERFPFVVHAPDPMNIYPQPASEGFSYVFEHYHRRIADLKLGPFADHPRIRKRRDSETVRWTEYWDAEERIYMVDDEVIYRGPNHYGRLPYIIGYPFPTPIIYEGDKLGLSLIGPVDDLLVYQDRLASQRAAAIAAYAWPVVAAKSPNPDRLDINFEPGTIIKLNPDDDIAFLQWQGPPPGILEQFQVIQAHLDQQAISMAAIAQQGGAASMNLALQFSKVKFAVARQTMEWALEDANAFVLRIVDRVVGEEVPIIGRDRKGRATRVAIGPEEIQGDYTNRVALNPTLPQDDVQRAAIAQRLYASGLISGETARDRFLAVPDPEAELAKVIAERLLQTPDVLGLIAQLLVQKLGITPPAPPSGPPAPPGAEERVGPAGLPQGAGVIPGAPEPQLPPNTPFEVAREVQAAARGSPRQARPPRRSRGQAPRVIDATEPYYS